MNNNNSDPFGEAAIETGQGTAQQPKQNSDQAAKAAEQGAAQAQSNQDLLNAMYGSSSDQSQDGTPANAAQAAQANPQQKQLVDQQQLDAVRKKLHKQLHDEVYYNQLTAHEHRKPESTQERLEREKQQDEQKKMQDLEQKEKKQQVPLAVSRGQTSAERQRGAAG